MDETGAYGEMSLEVLLNKCRSYDPTHNQYRVLRAEIDLRVSKEQIAAATAQVRSAWFQLGAMVAMFLAVVATLAAPLIPQWVR
jgi:hypothetical protein